MENTSGRHEPFQEWIQEIESEKTRRYLQERVIKQMDWYSAKSRVCKIKYQRWTAASIISGGVIPVASVFADSGMTAKILIAALGAAVTGINAYLNLKNYKELWCIYRTNREWLLSVVYLYFNKVGIFKEEMDQDSRDRMLIDMCEKCFQQESESWKATVK